MENQEDDIISLGGNSIRTGIDATGFGAAIRFVLSSICFFIFIGNDIAKLFLRRKQTITFSELVKINIGALVSIFFSLFCFSATSAYSSDNDKGTLFISPFSYGITALLFLFIGFYIIVKSIRQFNLSKTVNSTVSFGQSTRLAWLLKCGWNEKEIETLGEPLYLVLLGLLFLPCNIFGASLIALSGLSIWLQILLQKLFLNLFTPVKQKTHLEQENLFHEVK